MKALLRIGFAALIALGLASQALRAERGHDESDAKATLIARLGRLQVQTTELPDPELLMARSARCDQPFLAGLVRTDGTDAETTRQLAGHDVVVRYAYLGAVGEHPSKAALVARWGWATLQFTVGARAERPPGQMALVAFPRSCGGLAKIDWAQLSP